MKKYKDFKKEILLNKKIKKEYELLQPEYVAIKKIIALRLKKNMTQKELAKKLGTKQSAISRLERQMINPTITFLARVASILGKKLIIDFR